MIHSLTHWLVHQLRDLALSALGIREDIRLVRRVGPELEEWRAARDEMTFDDLCPFFTEAELIEGDLVAPEATTQPLTPNMDAERNFKPIGNPGAVAKEVPYGSPCRHCGKSITNTYALTLYGYPGVFCSSACIDARFPAPLPISGPEYEEWRERAGFKDVPYARKRFVEHKKKRELTSFEAARAQEGWFV
jgi:hypothetical protein